MKVCGCFRLVAAALALALVFDTTSVGLAEVLSARGAVSQEPPPQFTEAPGPIYLGANPRRDPVGRARTWTARFLRDLEAVRARWRRQGNRQEPEAWQASTGGEFGDLSRIEGWESGRLTGGGLLLDAAPGGERTGSDGGWPSASFGGRPEWVSQPVVEAAGATVAFRSLQAGPPEGGGFMPGEGGFYGGGFQGAGTVNTHNGNRVHRVDIVSWPIRGGMSLSFTIWHNLQTAYDLELGPKWSSNYSARVDYTPGSSCIVRWGDGLTIPYSEASEGTFIPPVGIYDQLTLDANGFVITKKNQIRVEFYARSGNTYHISAIKDRNGNGITVTRNANHQVTQVSDPTGRTLTFQYGGDDGQDLVSVTDPAGRTWSFSYDWFSGFLTSIRYPLLDGVENRRLFTYDGSGGIASETDPKGKTWTWAYEYNAYTQRWATSWWKDPLNNQTSFTYNQTNTVQTDPMNHTVRHNYSDGLLVSVVDEAGFSESYKYDEFKNVIEVTDRRQKSWLLEYDERGNVVSVTNPLGKTWIYTYTSRNDVDTVTDPLNHTWNFDYDAAGNLEKVWDPLNRRRIFLHHDAYGQMDWAKDAYDNQWFFGYDGHGNLNSVTSPAPHSDQWRATYDVLGNTLSVSDPIPNTRNLEYDDWERLIKVIHPDGNYVRYFYDEADNLTEVRDELNRPTNFAYDNAHRLTDVWNAKNENTHFSYNNDSLVTQVRNGRGYSRLYSYTPRHETYSLALPDLTQEFWSYNANGDVSLYTNGMWQQTSYVYDDASRLDLVDYLTPTMTDTDFGYDNADRLISMVDGTGTTTWGYSDADDVTTLTTPQGTITYGYDNAARLQTMTQPGSLTTTYSYDNASRLVSVVNGFAETTSFDYDDASRLMKKTFASGVYETYSYDNRSRVASIVLKNSAHAVLSSHVYAYYANSDVQARTDDGVTTTFGYDAISQLTSETRAGYSASYTYDANGNRRTRTVNGFVESYICDSADKLLEIRQNDDAGPLLRSFSYDAAGRTVSSYVPGVGTTSYAIQP